MLAPRLPAAAELVCMVLQERARQLHRADALVAEAPAAMGQVLAVVLLGDREQAPGRALDRVANGVVAEDVAKAGLLLEHRAGQRDGDARAPRLAHDHAFEAPAVGVDRAREGPAARRDVAPAAIESAVQHSTTGTVGSRRPMK